MIRILRSLAAGALPAAPGLGAAEPGPVRGGWLARAQREIAAREHRASESRLGLQATNRAHDLRTCFEPTGIPVHDCTAPGSPELCSLSLAGVGGGTDLVAPALDRHCQHGDWKPRVRNPLRRRIRGARGGVEQQRRNGAEGVFCGLGCQVGANVVTRNPSRRIYARNSVVVDDAVIENASLGIDALGSVVRSNAVRKNTSIEMLADSATAYAGNGLDLDAGGDAFPQVGGAGHEVGANICGGAAIRPRSGGFTMRRIAIALSHPGLLLALVLAVPAGAVPPSSVTFSPDVTVTLGGAGTTATDEGVALDDLMGVVATASFPGVPERAAVTAYHLLPNGDVLFALDTAAELPGPLVVERRDVVRFTTSKTYTLEFDGSAHGVPDAAAIDAVSVNGSGVLLLSFDVTVAVGVVVAADEDVVGWDGASFWPAVDASALGVPEAVDTDAIHDPQDGNGVFSFDTGGSVGGVAFDDDDVLVLDFANGSWSIVYDGSTRHAALEAADIEAVALPEPGELPMLAAGLGALLVLRRLRRTGSRSTRGSR